MTRNKALLHNLAVGWEYLVFSVKHHCKFCAIEDMHEDEVTSKIWANN